MNFHSRKQPSTRRHIPVKLLVLTLSFLLSLQGLTFLLPEKADSSLVYAGTEASEPFMENLLFLGDSMIYNPEDIRKLSQNTGTRCSRRWARPCRSFSESPVKT